MIYVYKTALKRCCPDDDYWLPMKTESKLLNQIELQLSQTLKEDGKKIY